MSDTKKHEIKEQTKTFKGKDGKDYVIKVTEKKEINYPNDAKGDGKTKSNDKLAIKIKEKGKEDKDLQDATIETSYTSGWFLPGSTVSEDSEIKLTDDTTVVTTKEAINLDVKGFEAGTYISGAVVLVILAALGYWWYTSSRNEEDEEETGL